MADADTIPTNGHTRPVVADSRNVVGDTSAVGKKTRTTLVYADDLAAVDAEQERLGWPGSRIAFISRILRTGLQASAGVQPVDLDGQLAATIRPANGAKS